MFKISLLWSPGFHLLILLLKQICTLVKLRCDWQQVSLWIYDLLNLNCQFSRERRRRNFFLKAIRVTATCVCNMKLSSDFNETRNCQSIELSRSIGERLDSISSVSIRFEHAAEWTWMKTEIKSSATPPDVGKSISKWVSDIVALTHSPPVVEMPHPLSHLTCAADVLWLFALTGEDEEEGVIELIQLNPSSHSVAILLPFLGLGLGIEK